MRIPKVLFNQGTLGKWEPEFESKFDKAVYYAGKSPIPKGKNQQKVSNWFKSLGIKYEDIKEHREKIKDKINELINEEGAWEIFPDVYVPAVSQDFEIGDPEEEDEEVPEGLDDLLGDIKEEPKADTKTLDIKKFLGEEKYDKYYDELVKEGKIDGQSLSPEERKEGYQTYRKDKINFGKFVEKVLAAKAGVDADTSQKALPTSALVKYNPSKSASSGDRLKVDKEPSEQREKTDKLLENVVEINKSVTNILSSLTNQNKLFKKGEETDRKQRENLRRKTREENLEKNKGKIGKIFKSVLKPIESVFSRLKNFIIFTLLGRAFKLLTDFFSNPENKGKIQSLGRFLKDWWPALTALIIGFGTPFGAAVRGFIKIVSGLTLQLLKLIPGLVKRLVMLGIKNPLALVATGVAATGVAAIMANQDDTAVVKDPEKPNKSQADEIREFGGMTGSPMGGLFNGGGMVPGSGPNKDTVPAMLTPGEFVMSRGAVQNIGVTNLMKMNAAGGGTNQPVVKNAVYANGGGLIGNHKIAYDTIQKNFPTAKPFHIAAAIGNFETEAPGLKPNTYQMGGGPGRGIAQWEIDHKGNNFRGRWPTAEKMFGINVINNLKDQLNFMKWEMNTGHPLPDGSYNLPFGWKTQDEWLKTTNLRDATKNFMEGYEAPGEKHEQKRLKNAQDILGKVKIKKQTKDIAEKSIKMNPVKVMVGPKKLVDTITDDEGLSRFIPKPIRKAADFILRPRMLDTPGPPEVSMNKNSFIKLPDQFISSSPQRPTTSGGNKIPNIPTPFTATQKINAEIYGIT